MILFFSLLFQLTSNAQFRPNENSVCPVGVPVKPYAPLTQGSLCNKGNEYRQGKNGRYLYCNRAVGSKLKLMVMESYYNVVENNRNIFKYVTLNNRSQFKIDHYIPLSMGGSNEFNNLWPQHACVNRFTDQYEHLLYQKLSHGMITQKDAINILLEIKADFTRADAIYEKYFGRNSSRERFNFQMTDDDESILF